MSSAIAAKKAQQVKGHEGILFYAGITSGLVAGILALLLWALKWELGNTPMTPILYFLMMSGLCLGVGSYIRENRDATESTLKNLLISLIILGIIGGAICGAYMW